MGFSLRLLSDRAMKCCLHCSTQTDTQLHVLGNKARLQMPAAPLRPCQAVAYPIEKFRNISYSLLERKGKKTCPQLFWLVSFCILMHTESFKNCPGMHFSAVELTQNVLFFFVIKMLVQPLSKEVMTTHFS